MDELNKNVVIVVPADPSQPCRFERSAVESRPEVISAIVGSPSERTIWDRDAALWINGNGAIDGLAPNERATRYAMVESEAAERIDSASARWLHGDAVIEGYDIYGNGEYQPVPERLLEMFRDGRLSTAQAEQNYLPNPKEHFDMVDTPEEFFDPTQWIDRQLEHRQGFQREAENFDNLPDLTPPGLEVDHEAETQRQAEREKSKADRERRERGRDGYRY